MKITAPGFLFILSASLLLANGGKLVATPGPSASVLFTENKGQISDQYYQPRTDVLYGGIASGMTFHLRTQGISYQLMRHGNTEGSPDGIYRLDVNWLNCKGNTDVITDKAQPGYNNYYLPACPGGALDVRSYDGITYKQIYKGIDLHYYSKNGSLKYDFLVSPFADHKQIRMEIQGAKKITLLPGGAVVITTPFGEIREEAPMVYQGNKQIRAAWHVEGTKLSFRLGSFDPSKALVIDPVVRVWGTFYGGTDLDQGIYCSTSGTDVYMTGWIRSTNNIATIGAHQATMNVNSNTLDAFLVKFDQNGARLWGTYYGDSGSDRGLGCAADPSGNIYMCGSAEWGTIHATVGSHQPVHGGGLGDAFLVKFNSSGTRLWGTYYGGTGDESGTSCYTDASGNVFMAGGTSSSGGTVIATVGSHQATFGGSSDGFLIKFDNAGVRQWGTYYGAAGGEGFYAGTIDATGNIYLTGTSTGAGLAVATAGAHQTVQGGNGDALLVKFNAAGLRQWGTLYGGTASDFANAVACDPSGNVFITGTTQSTLGTVFATSGAYKGLNVGIGNDAYDAFLAKFDPAGVRLWGTYYGDVGPDNAQGCATDQAGNVYISGATSTTVGSTCTALATAGSHQPVLNNNGYGGNDAFIAKFSAIGARVWGSYYGAFGSESGASCCVDAGGAIYMTGTTGQNSNLLGSQNISSVSAFQAGFGGGIFDAFLVKFADCVFPAPPVDATPPSSQTVCSGFIATLSATAAGTVRWYETAASIPVLGTGISLAVKTSSPGVYTYYAAALTCAENNTRTAVTITVLPSPTIAANSGTVCSGQPFTVTPSGAGSYTISGGSFTVSPFSTTHYSVTGAGTNGCASPDPIPVTVTVHPLPTLTVSSGFICVGGTYTIQRTGAVSYSVTGNSFGVSPPVTSSYTVTGTDLNGCISAAAISTVTVNHVFPTVTVNSGTLCPGKTFTIIPSGASSYVYSSTLPTVSPLVNTNYTVTGYASNSCSAAAVSNVTVIPLPVNIAATSGTLCRGQSATLTASGASSYSWSTGATGPGIVVAPQVGTPYMVTGTDASSGCSVSKISSVSVLPVPAITLISSNSIICRGEPATLTALGAGTFSWSNASSGNTSVVTPSSTTSYSVWTTGTNGCIGTASFKQTVDFCSGLQPRHSFLNSFYVYPNPNDGKFFIETSAALHIVVMNSLGQTVFSGSVSEGKNQLTLSELPAGVYFVATQGAGETKVVKMIRN